MLVSGVEGKCGLIFGFGGVSTYFRKRPVWVPTRCFYGEQKIIEHDNVFVRLKIEF